MNKQEAIERIESSSFDIDDTDLVVGLTYTKSIINQINEPEKVVVPKFVANRIEFCKKYPYFWTLDKVLRELDVEEKLAEWVYNIRGDLIPERVNMIAKAWLAYPNIEVESEELYTVEIPNPNLNAHVVLQKTGDGLVLVTVGNAGWAEWESSKLTEEEIKKDFEWAWKWAKPVEGR